MTYKIFFKEYCYYFNALCNYNVLTVIIHLTFKNLI